MYNIIIDTGFWIALLDPGDDPNRTGRANDIYNNIKNENFVIPFPTFYEFVNSQFSREKNNAGREELENILKTVSIEKIFDTAYRDLALKNFFTQANYQLTDISLVDEIIKLIIQDKKYRIDYIATFDKGLLNFSMANGVHEI